MPRYAGVTAGLGRVRWPAAFRLVVAWFVTVPAALFTAAVLGAGCRVVGGW